jgi:hypothetical protein
MNELPVLPPARTAGGALIGLTAIKTSQAYGAALSPAHHRSSAFPHPHACEHLFDETRWAETAVMEPHAVVHR